MAGICRSCHFFRADMHPDTDAPHHCAALDQPLNEHQAGHLCPEHKAPEQ